MNTLFPFPFFKEVGLRLPLGPLIVNFLRYCNMSLDLLAVNFVWIISGIEKLNEVHGTNLGLIEFQYYYSLNP